ncbi:MAG TPA: DinB family protein [Armatimonadota bacterium]|nr:DinB family protein [Armatimonadota bacterium]
MHPFEGLAGQAAWAGKNTAYNLQFIPEEKLAWKPAPTANSALEIINHVAGFTLGMTKVLQGETWSDPQFAPATNLREAQDLITSAADGYAAALRQVPVERLAETVHLSWAPFPMVRAAAMPVVDLIHHHGQIAYIQALLGDPEMHFFEEV